MNWKGMSFAHKVATVIAGIAALIGAVGMAKPDLFPIDPVTPAIAVFTLCEAVVNWNEKRKFSILLITAAVISMTCFILELMLL